ncbi:MAG: ATP-binding protein [Bacteroidota bacterium]
MFYNRVEELRQLRTTLARKRSQLVVLYGRRRCGKSTLIRHLLRPGDVYHQAVVGDFNLHRDMLAHDLASRFPDMRTAAYRNWFDFFTALQKRGGERFTLVLDEFPFLAEASPSLPSILQRLLDRREELNFHLILCGSSQQMMENTILSATAPLYGRADAVLKIQPLWAGYLQEHLPDVSAVDIVTEYSVWGGIPRYWELRDNYSSLAEAIQEMLLSPGGILRDEPRRLLLEDLRNLVQPNTLLTFVAAGAHRLSEIGARTQRTAAQLARPLNRLIELGVINKETPFGTHQRNTKQTLYYVSDHFLRFYHRFVLPASSQIAMQQREVVWNDLLPQLPAFTTQSWEELCRQAVLGGLLPEVNFQECKRWWGKTKSGKPVEIDLVARSTDGQTLLLGECKWSKSVDLNRLHFRLTDLAKDLPFYRGESIQTRVFAQEGGDIGPEQVLAALRSSTKAN